ncbi:hypothetical protein HDU93_007529 [Gonapodya sp. JEL0774]|nr:hypothetical protein HDU93_007529 [Gonapodya sp. JEL0774]
MVPYDRHLHSTEMSGLTQRRRPGNDSRDDEDWDWGADNGDVKTTDGSSNLSSRNDPPVTKKTADGRVIAVDPKERFGDELDDDAKKDGGEDRGSRLTILEEILLLGIKDEQGYLSFWNDNISYVLRGAILIELSLRNRISITKESRRRPLSERLVEVVNETPTGEVLLDEALKYIKLESQSVGSWIDLLSGETWNLMKIGYQLKQVRERIAKGLVDKGVLRTEKRNFVVFDMATHPLTDSATKEALLRRVVDTLLGRIANPDRRTIGMVCSAYAANVVENALINLSHTQREAAFAKVDEMLQEHSQWTEKSKAAGVTEVMAGVLNVFTKMDSLL